MTLLTVVQDVCAAVGVERPGSVFMNINANRTMAEMLALANEMAQRISNDSGHDWQVMTGITGFTGNGVTTQWPLPESFLRLKKDSNVWRSSNVSTPLRFIASMDEWLQRRNRGYTDPVGEWQMRGFNTGLGMEILPALGLGETATFAFVDKNIIRLRGNTSEEADVFQNDDDTFWIRGGDRLLKLGMVWQWKANKGSPYAEDLSTYNDALAMMTGSDQPAPIIVGRMPISQAARIAYPFPIDPGMVPL